MQISTDNGWFSTIGSRTPVLVNSLKACDPRIKSHFPKGKESSEAKTAFPKQFKYMKIKTGLPSESQTPESKLQQDTERLSLPSSTG